MRQLLAVAALIVGVPTALTATPLAASTLFDQCNALIQAADSTEGSLCDAYLRGFLQGAKSAGGKQRAANGDESWTDRAARTRLGAAALARASYCVPSDLSAARLAELFVQHVNSNPEIKHIDARSALEATLHVNYRCTGG
jgi:hypothetical protein